MSQQNNNQQLPFKTYFRTPAVNKRFQEVLGDGASGFVTSLVNLASQDKNLENADPNSVMQAAMVAATLKLPIEKSLGFAYVIPYGRTAQFQLGYKGLIQLALRSGQVVRINSGEVYEEQFKSFNPLTEDLEIDATQVPDESKTPIGYFAFMRLANGFEKTIFWTYDKVLKHGKQYSRSFNSKSSPWQTDFNAMAEKTLLKQLLGTYAPLSTDMQKAIIADNEDSKIDERNDVTPAQPSNTLLAMADKAQAEEPTPTTQDGAEQSLSTDSTVPEIKAYLDKQGISYPVGSRKHELLQLAGVFAKNDDEIELPDEPNVIDASVQGSLDMSVPPEVGGE